jgi:hypothetical protein
MENTGEQAPLHYIEEDLSETWVEDYAKEGVAELEVFLHGILAARTERRQKHDEFNEWLAARGQEPDQIDETTYGGIPAPKTLSPLAARARAEARLGDVGSERVYPKRDEFNSHPA